MQDGPQGAYRAAPPVGADWAVDCLPLLLQQDAEGHGWGAEWATGKVPTARAALARAAAADSTQFFLVKLASLMQANPGTRSRRARREGGEAAVRCLDALVVLFWIEYVSDDAVDAVVRWLLAPDTCTSAGVVVQRICDELRVRFAEEMGAQGMQGLLAASSSA